MAPPGSIISFTGNNRNRRNPRRNCPGPQGMGHMTVKTILEEKSIFGKSYLEQYCHFICDDCGTTYCLDHVTIPSVQLPSGFKHKQTDVVVSGVCEKCDT